MGPWVGLRSVCVLSVVALAVGLGAGAARAQTTRPAADGLLVKLKNGVSQESFDQTMTRRTERMKAVIRDAGIQDDAVRTRAVGRLQRIEFGRTLQPDEVEQTMRRLAARPDVEWVVPDRFERRMVTPNDPGFAPGFLRADGSGTRVPQWWLYSSGGQSSDPIALRRRGVPDFPAAWNLTTGLPSAPVAVLDTGIVLHTQLLGQTLPGYDFVSKLSSDAVDLENDGTGGRDSDPTDPGDWVTQADVDADPVKCRVVEPKSSWHGTIVAGLIASRTNDLTGAAGINWQGRILPVRVAGKCGARVSDIIDGMRWAAGLTVPGVPDNPLQNRARIINLSFGGSASLGCLEYQDTIDELRAIGVVIVAAAGNEQTAVSRPARCPGVIGVAATNRDGFKANYSNFGPEVALATVGGDLQGTGEGNWSAILGDEGLLGLDIAGDQGPATPPDAYALVFGTSFSAPIVAGAISLMLSVNPSLTYDEIVEGLTLSARKHVTSNQMPECSSSSYGRCICTLATCGVGLLDVGQAVLYAQSPAGYSPPTRLAANIDSPEIAAALQLGADEPDAEAGGGGGALQPAWLLALALLTLLLAYAPRARYAERRARR